MLIKVIYIKTMSSKTLYHAEILPLSALIYMFVKQRAQETNFRHQWNLTLDIQCQVCTRVCRRKPRSYGAILQDNNQVYCTTLLPTRTLAKCNSTFNHSINKYTSCKILFDHYMHSIIITIVKLLWNLRKETLFCAKFQNDWATEEQFMANEI